MNATELMTRLIEHSDDADGINDRFMGNAELYESCFMEFMEELHMDALRQAIAAKDYAKAFDSAHALKGLSGNLGLSAFYGAICALVESLRAGSYGDVEGEYAEVERQYLKLKAILSGEPSLPAAPAGAQSGASSVSANTGTATVNANEKKQKDIFIPASVTALALILVCVGLLFIGIFANYRDNIAMESAEHLIEINYQVKLYIEEKIVNDWKIARSVSAGIAENSYADDAGIFKMIQQRKAVWEVTDLILYTEKGYSFRSDGSVEANDVASDIIDRARDLDGYMSIIDSEIMYTVPVETELKYRGSKVVAVSVVQRMGTFLDDMGFSSFDGKAWMYLTEENGIVISRLTNASAIPAFNFMAIANERKVTALTDEDISAADMLSVATPTAFMMSGAGENNYVVSTPISTRGMPLRLFYLAPADVVNETMNSFSRRLVFLSLSVMSTFAVFAALVLMIADRGRKRQFDKALLARERMFGLLVQNTQTAFGLFHINQNEPTYISGNCVAVVGDEFIAIDESDSKFRLRNSAGTDTDAIRQINDCMRDWDGKSRFKSGYILNDRSVPPNYFELQLYPVDGESGDFVGIAQDVTQAWEREKATQNALDMAERANDAKSLFLSNMSHDIRTPMNAIVNMTNFALESVDQPQKLSGYLQTIRESSDHLLRLINDVLDMSRIESGQTVVEYESFDIIHEMKKQVDMIRPLCEVKHHRIITDFGGVNTTILLGDRLKFAQVIMNLLGNAVKFTLPNGTIRFTASEIPSLRDDMVDMRFTIEDNGIGMSKDFIPRIFDPFSRADDKRVSKIEGTGLGLSICRSYVAAMGGTIMCESEEGKGSVFTVELFFGKADATPETVYVADTTGGMPFTGKRCLVVEDNDVNQTIAVVVLERLGFTADVASDGSESVRKFLKSKPGDYDIIYMDIRMPVMDGYQAAMAIRASGHPQAKTIPIVAMTANVFAEDIEKARVSGMDGHLGKPIMSISIIEETKKALDKRKEIR